MAIKHTRAPSRSRGEWARLIEAWKASGLSAAQFATSHGLKPKALSTWRWRLKTQPIQPAGGSAPKLVQLSVADLVGPGDTDATRWELTTVLGHRLRVQAPLAGTELAQLLGTLVPGRGRR
jgi:hypothetical protein